MSKPTIGRRQLVRPQKRWAVTRSPRSMPCLFGLKRDAVKNCDADEYVVQVFICEPRDRRVESEELAHLNMVLQRKNRRLASQYRQLKAYKKTRLAGVAEASKEHQP